MATKKTITMSTYEDTDDELMNEIIAEFSKSKSYSLQHGSEADVQYPTGFWNIDYKNGQRVKVRPMDGNCYEYDSVGLVDGSINMYIGRSGCGKSTIVEQIAANVVRQFKNGLVFIESVEGGITDNRLEVLTGFSPIELEKRVRVRKSGVSIESLYQMLRAIHNKKISNKEKYRYATGLLDSRGKPIEKFVPTVVIIDSLAMLAPEKLTQEEELSGQMSTTATAKMLAQLFRRITPMIKESNIILLIVNHITQKVEINAFSHTKSQNAFLKQDETLPGGVTPLYLANNVFRLDDGTKLTEDKEFGINGCHVNVSNIKSRTAESGLASTCDMIFNYATGFDPDLSLYMMLKNNGKINGAGAYLYIGDRDDKKFSQRGLKQKLWEDEEFRNIFMNAVVEDLRSQLDREQKAIELSKSATSMGIASLLNQYQASSPVAV